MAMGARKAFQEITNESDRDRWLKLPYIPAVMVCPKRDMPGCLSGPLGRNCFAPARPTPGNAIEMLHRALTKGQELPSVPSLRRLPFLRLRELKPKFR